MRPFIVAALLVAVSGCRVGPDYEKPRAEVPSAWAEPAPIGDPAKGAALRQWWRSFGDPELDSLVDRALRGSPDLRAALARVREARARYGVAEADGQPAAGAAASFQRQKQSGEQPVFGAFSIPDDAFQNNVYNLTFDATWEVDLFGGLRREREEAAAEVAASDWARRDVALILVADVVRNYVELRGCQRRLAIARANVRAQEESSEIVRERFDHGLAPRLDVDQAAATLATTRAEIPALVAGEHIHLHRLGVLLGLRPDSLGAELESGAKAALSPPRLPVGMPSEMLLRRPDVREAEQKLVSATAGIGVARSDLFPKFLIAGSAGGESVVAGDWFSRGSRLWTLGPVVQWKLFDAGRLRARVRAQTAAQEQALAAYEQTVLVAFAEVEDRLVAYGQEQARHRDLAEAAGAAGSALDSANRLYAGGLSDFLRVADAERTLYRSQEALALSEEAIAVDLIALYKALGGGWD